MVWKKLLMHHLFKIIYYWLAPKFRAIAFLNFTIDGQRKRFSHPSFLNMYPNEKSHQINDWCSYNPYCKILWEKITKLTGEIQIAQEDGHQEKKTSFLSEKRGRKFSDQAGVKSTDECIYLHFWGGGNVSSISRWQEPRKRTTCHL